MDEKRREKSSKAHPGYLEKILTKTDSDHSPPNKSIPESNMMKHGNQYAPVIRVFNAAAGALT